MKYLILGLSGAAVAAFAGAEQTPRPKTLEYEGVASTQPNATGQGQELTYLRDAANRMTVHVTVQDKGPFNFLVDTGADHTVVSRDLAGRLSLDRRAGATLYSVTGEQRVGTTAIGSMKFSTKTLRNVKAAVLDHHNIGADGILGIDSLRSERVTFDFKKRTMTIVPSVSRPERTTKDEIVVRGRLRGGRLVLTRATAASRRLNVVVDTGADMSIGNQALYRSLRGTRMLKPLGKVQMQSVTGEMLTGDLMSLDQFELAGIVVRDLNIVFADARTFKTLGLENKPALLMGMNTLQAFEKVSIDFANRKFRVVMPEESSLRSFMLASSGVRYPKGPHT